MRKFEIKSWEEYKTEAESGDPRDLVQYGNYHEIANSALMVASQEDLMKRSAEMLGYELGIALNENGLRPVEQLQTIVKKFGDEIDSPLSIRNPLHTRDTIGVKITAKPTGEREDWARYVYVQAVRAIRAYNERETALRNAAEALAECTSRHRIAAMKLVNAGVLTADQAEAFGYSKPWTRQYEHKVYDDLQEDFEDDPGEAGCDDGQEVEEKKEENHKNDYSTWHNTDFD